MRQVIDTFLYNKKNAILLVADFGKFPLMETTDRYYNVGLSETLLVNTAIGLALAGKHIFIYSAANFIIYRAFELIKLYLNDLKNNLNITFLNGGAGFCYAECGRGHYLIDDLYLLTTLLNNICIYTPYDKKTTILCLTKSFKKINYIRLCFDDAKDFNINIQQKNIIITFGWLVLYIDTIINEFKLNYNVYPIVDINNFKINFNNFNKCKLIYDNTNIKCFDNIKQITEIKNIKNIFNETGYSRDFILNKYLFDKKSIYNFIIH